MKKIRILHVVPNMQSGGLETLIMNIYRNIDRDKIQFDFLVHYKEKKFYDDEILKLGGKIYRFSLRDDNNIFKYMKELDDFFKKHQEYKIVHCHMASIGALVFKIAKKNNIKVRIAHSHNSNTEKTFKGLVKKIMVQPYKYFSTNNFACSMDAGRFLFKNKPFQIVNNGINIDKFSYNVKIRNEVRDELGISKNDYVIGHIGRFCEQKNHRFLIDVFHKISDKKTKLLLVGTGELEDEIKTIVKKYKIESRVLFLENRNDVEKIYQAMDCFAFPSVFEGLGIVLIEAQASGLKTFCSDNIPRETQVTDNIEYLKLDENLWVKKIKSNINTKYERKILDKRILEFDIKSVAKKMEDDYIAFYKGVENE